MSKPITHKHGSNVVTLIDGMKKLLLSSRYFVHIKEKINLSKICSIFHTLTYKIKLF